MKLNIIDKSIIAVVAILIISAIVSTIKTSNSIPVVPQFIGETSPKTKAVPDNILELTDKYNAYQELYKSDKPTLVYGYNKFNVDEKYNKIFHKKLTKKIAEQNIKFNILPVENHEDQSSRIIAETKEKTGTCSPQTDKDFDALINTSENCLEQACIIDMKNKKYTVIERNIDTIVNTLREYNSAAN